MKVFLNLQFQFLMVQLKESVELNHRRNKLISIPYGSIKSTAVCGIILGISDFNSLWFN